MNVRSQIICAWSGIVCVILMFGGLIIAGFFPPLMPGMSAEEVAAVYRQNGNAIRLGMILVQMAGALFGAFAAGISAQLRRVEHRATPVLSYAQLAMGAASIILFVVPAMLWIAASYRPDRSIEITQALNDLGWLMFIGIWAVGFAENLLFGFVILGSKSANPVFPRWLGFLNIWIALLFTPAAVMPFFKSGPFAWNGLLAFWLPATAFGAWIIIIAAFIMKAVRRQAAAGA